MPNGRLSRPVGERSACCSNNACRWCPVYAKFTALNSMQHVIEHPDLDICVDSKVEYIDVQNKSARLVRFVNGGKEYTARGELIVLGANGINSPVLLHQSGFNHSLIGKNLHEKIECTVEVYLDGVKNFSESTLTTGMNLSLLDGEHRRHYGGALLYFDNTWNYGMRPEYGRWREILPLTISVEALPQSTTVVSRSSDGRPHVSFPRQSEYGLKGVDAALDKLPAVLKPLPVERIERRQTDEIASPTRYADLFGGCRRGVSGWSLRLGIRSRRFDRQHIEAPVSRRERQCDQHWCVTSKRPDFKLSAAGLPWKAERGPPASSGWTRSRSGG